MSRRIRFTSSSGENESAGATAAARVAVLDRGAPATGVLDVEERRGNAPPKAVGEGVGVGAEVAKRGWGVAARPVTTGGLGEGVGRRSAPPEDDAVDDDEYDAADDDEDDNGPAKAADAG
jgi:hypothetical protein